MAVFGGLPIEYYKKQCQWQIVCTTDDILGKQIIVILLN